MSNLIIKIVGGILTSLAGFFIIKKISKSDEKLLCLKNIFLLTLLVLITVLFYQVNYAFITPIITYGSIVIIYKFIFSYDIIKSFVLGGIVWAIMFIADIIVASAFMLFISPDQLRGDILYALMSNFLVALTSIGIANIKFIKNIFTKFVDRFNNYSIKNSMIFIFILIMGLTVFLYYFTVNYQFNLEYIVNVTGMIVLFILMLIYAFEKNKYDKLNTEYDNLFEYVQTFEEWIEKEQLNMHESKNQLITLRSMITAKKAKDYIDNILNEKVEFEQKNVEQLKNIPKGGLKGLLYYKILVSQKEKIEITTDISDKVYKFIKKLSPKQLKDICRLIGIYFDNAIEAVKECKRKKNISIELYVIKESLNIVIMNTIEKKVDRNLINNKGVSSKGKGRGNGLYFAKKIVKSNSHFSSEQNIINNYYLQKLIINPQKKNEK